MMTSFDNNHEGFYYCFIDFIILILALFLYSFFNLTYIMYTFISNEMLSSNDIFLRSFDHYMKPEKRRCIQAVRKTKLISFFALYSIRFSILCNIITGSVQHSVYCIQRKESDKYIRVCIYSFFSLRSGASNVVRTIRCI